MTDLAIKGTNFRNVKGFYVTAAERNRDAIAFKSSHFFLG